MLALWKGARHLDPETWENNTGHPNTGPGLSTATERKTLPHHLRLAEAAMRILPHLTVVPSESFCAAVCCLLD